MTTEMTAIYTTGQTLYGVVLYGIQPWNNSTSAFETYNSANWADYVIAMTESPPETYTGTVPVSALSQIGLILTSHLMVGATVAITDPIVASGEIIQTDQTMQFGFWTGHTLTFNSYAQNAPATLIQSIALTETPAGSGIYKTSTAIALAQPINFTITDSVLGVVGQGVM